MIWGALFDWDGVVVNSVNAHEESWFMLAREKGLPLTSEMFRASFGCTNKIIIPEAYKWTTVPSEIEELGQRKEVLYREIIATKNADEIAVPGSRELLHALHEAGIPCAVGSSTPLENITTVLDKLGLRECFRAIVSAEDVKRGKPDPEVFLKGAAALELKPANCVVFEDAVHGIEAGKTGGMKTVAVLTTHPRKSFEGLADRIVSSMTDVTLPMLEGLWA